MSEEILSYPLLALVGQAELKTALVLAVVNPQIGGILLIGPYGVGKTTAVRGLIDLLPVVERHVTDEHGNTTLRRERMRLVELPLNARLEDVVGGINERVAIEQQRVVLQEGVLAHADGNLLYIDEINLLDEQVVDAILDAAAQGRTLVRRGAITRLYHSQFVLAGSMNPEEGMLRPQILDRFGLRVWVQPLQDPQERLEVYRRARAFREDPAAFRRMYAPATQALMEEVAAAREILPHVTIDPQVELMAMGLVQALRVPSHRAELALLEAARARAAADYRDTVSLEDLTAVAPLALRQRRSQPLEQFGASVAAEDEQIMATLQQIAGTR